MDLAARKLQLMEQFMKIANIETVEKLELFFKKEVSDDTDVWNEMPDTVQKIVEKSLEESNNGKVTPSSQVMARVRAKYNVA